MMPRRTAIMTAYLTRIALGSSFPRMAMIAFVPFCGGICKSLSVISGWFAAAENLLVYIYLTPTGGFIEVAPVL